MGDAQLQPSRRRKRWRTGTLIDPVKCETCPRRTDNFAIVPRALRRRHKTEAVKRQAAWQVPIQTSLLTKSGHTKDGATQDEDKKIVVGQRFCHRRDCTIIDVDDYLDLHFRGPPTLEAISLASDATSKDKKNVAQLQSKPVQFDENPEPDSEPDAKAIVLPSAPHLTAQPDSEPEIEHVVSTRELQETGEKCVRPSLNDAEDISFAITSDFMLRSGINTLEDGKCSRVYSSLMANESEFQALDDTTSVIHGSLLHSARLNNATAVSNLLKALEQYFYEKHLRDAELIVDASPGKILQHARQVGHAVCRALCRISNEVSSSASQTRGTALLADLSEFSKVAASISLIPTGQKGKWNYHNTGSNPLGGHTSLDNAEMAADKVWNCFGGIEGYVTHLQKIDSMQHVGSGASGSAVWQRLTSEMQAAIQLAEPRQPVVHSNDLSWVCNQLHYRICYMAARVAWTLDLQARAALALMRDESSRSQDQHSPETQLVAIRHASLLACPVIEEILHGAFQDAASRSAAHFLETLAHSLQASCWASLTQEVHPRSNVQTITVIMKERLAVQAVAWCSTALVEFRETWLHGEIEAMGLGRRHREIVDRRQQSSREAAVRSKSTFQMLQKIVAEWHE